MKNIISQITMEELEKVIYRSLQRIFSKAMASILTEMDATIANARDKKRFKVKVDFDFCSRSFYNKKEIYMREDY